MIDLFDIDEDVFVLGVDGVERVIMEGRLDFVIGLAL